MSFQEKLERFNEKISDGAEWIGAVAFVSMMLLTTADVIGAKIFKNPIPGALDLMMLAQLLCVSFALAASYIANRHVQVEFFMPLLPKPFRRIAGFCIQCLVLLFLVTMTWQMFKYGHELKLYGEVSPTIRIAVYPFTYAASIAFIPACLVSLSKVIKSFAKVLEK